MSSPVVYVIQDVPERNMTPALEYGDLDFLLPHGNVSRLSEEIIHARLKEKLLDYRACDFIILMGDPELFGIAVALCLNSVGSVRLLKWDKVREVYYPRQYKK